MKKVVCVPFLVALALLLVPNVSKACGSPCVTTTTTIITGDTSGILHFQIYIPIKVFGVAAQTNCACGIGIQGPLPPSFNLHSVTVLDSNYAPLPTFSSFALNAGTGSTLAAGGPFGSPVFAGATWLGFIGTSFPVPPQSGFFCFQGWIDFSEVWLLDGKRAQTAGGEGDINFDPVPGPHFLFADNGTINVVPEPGAVGIIGAGLFSLGLITRFRMHRR